MTVQSKIMKHYDKESQVYDKVRFRFAGGDYVNEIEMKMVTSNLKPGRVLELCCGTGRYGLLLGEMGFRYTGIDFSKEMLKAAKEKTKHLKNKYILMNANNLKFRRNIFDNIFIVRALKFLPNPQKTFKGSYKILKKNGRIIVTFKSKNYPIMRFLLWTYDNYNSVFKKMRKRFRIMDVKSLGEKFYYIDEVVEMLREAGFKVTHKKSYFNFPFYSFRSAFIIDVIRKLDNHFDFGWRTVVVGKKV